MKHDWIPNVILHGVLACCLFNIWGCQPDQVYKCSHREIPVDQMEEAAKFIIELVTACDFYHTNWVDIDAVEEVALRLYGRCTTNCRGESYYTQAQREIALEATFKTMVFTP